MVVGMLVGLTNQSVPTCVSRPGARSDQQGLADTLSPATQCRREEKHLWDCKLYCFSDDIQHSLGPALLHIQQIIEDNRSDVPSTYYIVTRK